MKLLLVISIFIELKFVLLGTIKNSFRLLIVNDLEFSKILKLLSIVKGK